MQRQQAVLEIIFADPPFHFAREFVKAATARGDDQFVKSLNHL
jgi:16S rRNA G966 N2-methylase RsmD